VVDGVSLGAVESYTFTNVTGSHTIQASFSILTYTISATAGNGGTISPLGTVVVNHGENQTFTITPDTGYGVADLMVDGVSVGASETYTFSEVTANHTIQASFIIRTYTISATAGNGGSISPSGNVIVGHGTTRTFTITPNSGYEIADVMVDGLSVGPVETFSFSNITHHHTIQASFNILLYTVSFQITDANTGTSIDDAQITFDGVLYEPGVYVFENLAAGSYPYTVYREGYIPYDNLANVTEETTLIVQMVPDDQPLPEILYLAKNQQMTITGEACYFSTGSIWVAGYHHDFILQPEGELSLVAEEKIRLLPGTKIVGGAWMHAHIAEEGVEYCADPLTVQVEDLYPSKENLMADREINGDEPEGKRFRVYPNPTKGDFTLELNGAKTGKTIFIEIYSMAGIRVFSAELPEKDKHILSLKDYQPGIYFVRVITGSQTGTERLIRQ